MRHQRPIIADTQEIVLNRILGSPWNVLHSIVPHGLSSITIGAVDTHSTTSLVSKEPQRGWERSQETLGTKSVDIHDKIIPQNNMAATIKRETSWRRRWKPNLNSQPWKHFSISGKSFLLKSMFVDADCSYEFCLWDFCTFLYEKVEHDEFEARAKV